jgi:NAD(P)H-hydrate repair Nnr-like enzyme with NAD(P)H-hydrate dehydratase domain
VTLSTRRTPHHHHHPPYTLPVLQAQELARALEGPLVLSKGQVDVLTDGTTSLVVIADGSPRRCGGQGDVLTGEGQLLCVGVGWVGG